MYVVPVGCRCDRAGQAGISKAGNYIPVQLVLCDWTVCRQHWMWIGGLFIYISSIIKFSFSLFFVPLRFRNVSCRKIGRHNNNSKFQQRISASGVTRPWHIRHCRHDMTLENISENTQNVGGTSKKKKRKEKMMDTSGVYPQETKKKEDIGFRTGLGFDRIPVVC